LKLLLGRQVTNHKEAIDKVFQVTGVDGISEDILDMFTSITSGDNINSEAKKLSVPLSEVGMGANPPGE